MDLTEPEKRARIDHLEHDIKRLSMQLKIKRRALKDLKPPVEKPDNKK